ncbi:MAG: hypothetical protein JWO82_3461 [Akkermansiaceae bacterium]|nr:hypothetical protein [Akkermansiaceae bacterium]
MHSGSMYVKIEMKIIGAREGKVRPVAVGFPIGGIRDRRKSERGGIRGEEEGWGALVVRLSPGGFDWGCLAGGSLHPRLYA